MRFSKSIHLAAFAVAVLVPKSSEAVNLRYTWMLPKTVIDATVAYTFDSCVDNKPKFKITPTLASRTVPDLLVGNRQNLPAALESASADQNISLQIDSSHILNSIGSNPTSQVGQIAGNILGGIAKLVGVALGVPSSAVAFQLNPPPSPVPSTPPIVTPACATGAGSAPAIAQQIKDLKAKILPLQTELANGVDDVTQKKNTNTLAAIQTLISALEAQITITIKTTIDPGVTPVDVNPENFAPLVPASNGDVQSDGLIARICPTKDQLAPAEGAKWLSNADTIFSATPFTCAAIPAFEVNVYLDFPDGKGTMFDVPGQPFHHPGAFEQTKLGPGDLYRDAGHIPVLVWRGSKDAPKKMPDGSPSGAIQLAAPQLWPFGQFGVAQALPFTPDVFQSLTWQVAFGANGEISTASFSSKSTGVNATSFFGTAASAANAIATEQRSAASATNQATTVQSQADLIYEQQRLALCQRTPATCPSK